MMENKTTTVEYNLHAGKTDFRRIIVRKGKEYTLIRLDDVSYFFLENRITFLVEKNSGTKYVVAKTLRELEFGLDNHIFYRANKKYLIHINSIEKFRQTDSGKIEILMIPVPKEKIFVSQVKASTFKQWVITGNVPLELDYSKQLVENEFN
jgi:two-component system, LytTR family, response regulator LytT